jgi:AcrR family transcriptional regulator
MEDIAGEAGVAYQTVYAIFGTKLRLAQGLIEIGFPHVGDALKLFEPLRDSTDLEVWFRTGARVSRLIYELCGDLLRFMRESGDPGLLERYRDREEQRFRGIDASGMGEALERSGRLRAGISRSQAISTIWTLSGPDPYTQLVFQRGWTPSSYEEWLGHALIRAFLQPAS